MTRDTRMRQEMLRGAFEENLDAIQGLPRGTWRRRQLRRLALRRRMLTVAALLVLATVSVAAWIGAGPGQAATRQAEAVAGGAPDWSVGRTIDTSEEPVGDEPGGGVPVEPARQARRIAEMLAVQQPREALQGVIPLAVDRVVVDAGHGGRDSGTALGYGLREKDLTLDIALRLGTMLEAAGYDVIQTRTSDLSVSLKERAEMANNARADVFVSIHVNWLPRREARGVETYYLGHTDDPFLRSLAATENRDSGFSMADYRHLLEGIYADVRQDQSRRLAESVQQSLFESLRTQNPQIENRGVMTAPFAVLVATRMPAILAEVACLSNDREARLLAISTYRQRIAEALLHGLSRYQQEETDTSRPAAAQHPETTRIPPGRHTP